MLCPLYLGPCGTWAAIPMPLSHLQCLLLSHGCETLESVLDVQVWLGRDLHYILPKRCQGMPGTGSWEHDCRSLLPGHSAWYVGWVGWDRGGSCLRWWLMGPLGKPLGLPPHSLSWRLTFSVDAPCNTNSAVHCCGVTVVSFLEGLKGMLIAIWCLMPRWVFWSLKIC